MTSYHADSLASPVPLASLCDQYNQKWQVPLKGKAMMWGIQAVGGLAIRESELLASAAGKRRRR